MQSWQRYPHLYAGLLVLSLSIVFLVIFYTKTLVEARRTYRQAEIAFAQNKLDEARLYYERTIMFYTPMSLTTSQAVNRLWKLGNRAEAQDNVVLALAAYRSLRSSLYAIQSIYRPYKDWIPKSEGKIASLMTPTTTSATSDTPQRASETAQFLRQLQHTTGPHLGWSLVTEVGFLGWIGMVIGFIWWAPMSPGGRAWKAGLMWGIGGVLFFALWVIGMLQT